ncbi:MAG: hypothetical protein ACTSQJ_05235 [Promethearchaeota archaeon]
MLLKLLSSAKINNSDVEEVIRFIKKEEKVIKTMIIESQKNILNEYPDYYQGLIILALVYFEMKEYAKAKDYAYKALQLLEKLGLEQSGWISPATELFKLADNLVGDFPEFLEFLNDIITDVKRKVGEKIGHTLQCVKCGNFNPRKSKFCLICGSKFTKNDLKKKS